MNQLLLFDPDSELFGGEEVQLPLTEDIRAEALLTPLLLRKP